MSRVNLTPLDIAREVFPVISDIAIQLAIEMKNRAFSELGTCLFLALDDDTTLSDRQTRLFERKVETILSIIEKACSSPKNVNTKATTYSYLEALVESKTRAGIHELRSLQSLRCNLKAFALRAQEFEGLLTLLQQLKTISELTPEDLGLDSSTKGKIDNVPGYPPHVNEMLYMTLDLHTSCHCQKQHLKMARLGLDVTEDHDGAEIPFEVLFPVAPLDTCGAIQGIPIFHETTMLVLRKRPGKNQTKRKARTQVGRENINGKELSIGEFCRHLQRKVGVCLRFQLALENSDPVLRTIEVTTSLEQPVWKAQYSQTFTLAGFLRERGSTIAVRDKFQLAYLLAKSVWQYYGSDWMKNPWTHDDIEFLENNDSSSGGRRGVLSAYNPYINSDLEQSETYIGEFCSAEGMVIHRYPGVIALAILLIEVIQGQPFGTYGNTQQYSFPNIKQSYKSAWKVMAENTLDCNIIYKEVIKKCLDGKIFKEAPFDPQDPQNGLEIRRTILYREIVYPLKHLLALSESLPSSGSEPQMESFTDLPDLCPVQDENLAIHAASHSLAMTAEQTNEPGPPLPFKAPQGTLGIYPMQESSRRDSPIPAQMLLRRPSSRDEFEIAIICALPLEYDAVTCLVDEFWDENGDVYGRAADDQNHYTTGRIDKYNVVLALLPGMGKANAASVASQFRSSYRGLQLALLVGICGGVPFNTHDEEILLGDVIISGSIVEYDLGRRFANEFRRKNTFHESLGRANTDVRSFITTLGTALYLKRLQARTAYHLQSLQKKFPLGRYDYPGVDEDKLFDPACRHKHHPVFRCTVCDQCTQISHSVCEEALLKSLCSDLQCDEGQLVQRKRLESKRKQSDINAIQEPKIHFGPVASGDTVMRSGQDRDSIALREKVIAFEMEGAGVWDNLSCIIIKGVCDYADSHKNKRWQNFAAATAASVMKAVLERYSQRDKHGVTGR
ncbi:hypothetical protein ABW21_db0208984 [Orbilia brochopaga]|nr:hypothetical protein ABW21_db0208984 [Drechslerella brochopaga]